MIALCLMTLIACTQNNDVVENSGLEYTILRPDWFTSDNEIDYMITHKGEPEAGFSTMGNESLCPRPWMYGNELPP